MVHYPSTSKKKGRPSLVRALEKIKSTFLTVKSLLMNNISFSGMDIYTREVATTNGNGNAVDHDSEKHLLTHCCKYLINFSTQARR